MTVAFRRTFASLRKHRNYRPFFTGQVVSLVGTWMQNIALAWYVVELTHSAVAVGFLAFCRFAPFTVFGLVSGVVADRFDNRRLVMVTQTASMVVALALTALAFSGAEIVGSRTHWPQPPVPRSSSMLWGAMRSRSRWSAARSFPMRSRSTRASSTARASSAPRSRASSSPRSASASASRSTLSASSPS